MNTICDEKRKLEIALAMMPSHLKRIGLDKSVPVEIAVAAEEYVQRYKDNHSGSHPYAIVSRYNRVQYDPTGLSKHDFNTIMKRAFDLAPKKKVFMWFDIKLKRTEFFCKEEK